MKRRGDGGESPVRKRRSEEPSGVSIKRESQDDEDGLLDVAGAETGGEEVGTQDADSSKPGEAPFGSPPPSTPPKVAATLSGAGTQPLSTAEMGLGKHFSGWSSRSARLLAVYVRQHYKQARPAEWRAMAQSPAGGDEDDEVASSGHSQASAGVEGQNSDNTAAARRTTAGPGPTVIDIDTDDLNDDLSCPICLRVIRKAVTTIECLHRFCTECIEKSLRLGQKECPTCRERCPSRRFLRPDPNFDALIAAIYPDLDAWERSETARIDEINKNHTVLHQTLLNNLREIQEDQNTVRKQRAGRADYICSTPAEDQASGGVEHALVSSALAGSADVAGVAVASGSGGAMSMDKIAVCLTRSIGCNNIPKILNSNLHIQPGSTIGGVCEYVRRAVQSKRQMQVIYRTACGEDVVLGENLVLSNIVPGAGGPAQSTVRLSYRPA